VFVHVSAPASGSRADVISPEISRILQKLTSRSPTEIPAAWQAGLSNGANVGEILGLFINGIVSERYGYRKTMLVSLVAVAAFIFIPFFARNLIDLQIGEILCGIPWGVFQTLTTAYGIFFFPLYLYLSKSCCYQLPRSVLPNYALI